MCVKGAALKQALYHPDRLKYPMKRIGERGEGKFERISWEEALTTIAQKLSETKDKYGAKQTLFYAGHPKWFRPQLTELANEYGTPNVGTESSTCAYSLMMACQSVFGKGVMMPMPDMRRCKMLVVWGVNALYSNPVNGGGALLNALQRGIKLIVIDPRCTSITEHADVHLRPIPGTDGALALGMAGGSVPPGPGRAVLKDAFMGTRKKRVNADQDISHEEFPAWAKLTEHEAQVTKIADYIEGKGDYPLRTVLSFGMNHHMWPRPERLEEAFKHLDFFVNADLYMTDTCKYADIILPVQASLEREQVQIMGLDTIFYQGHVAEPAGESRTDMDIITGIADKLGVTIGGDEPIRSHEEYLRKSLTTTGLTLEEVKNAPNGVKVKHMMPSRTSEEILKVKTPSGKIEFFSELLESCEKEGHEGLPVYHDFRENLPMDEYPLILTTGSRKPQLFHSRTYRLPWLANLEKYPVVEIHPEDAKELCMEDEEMVVLVTPVGSMELCLSVNSSCLRGTVNVYHGAGEKDINLLLDDTYLDPVSGFPGYKSYCCRLEKKEVSHE